MLVYIASNCKHVDCADAKPEAMCLSSSKVLITFILGFRERAADNKPFCSGNLSVN